MLTISNCTIVTPLFPEGEDTKRVTCASGRNDPAGLSTAAIGVVVATDAQHEAVANAHLHSIRT
jgi:hypothetical protein